MAPPKKLKLNQKKSVWRTRITVSSMILIALGTVAFIAYYTLVHRSVSGSLHRARVAMKSGDVDAAEAAIRTAIAKDPASEESFKMLAEVLLAQGREGEAAVALITVSQLNPFNKEVFTQALQLLENGRYDADIILLLSTNGLPNKDLTPYEQHLLTSAWTRMGNTASAAQLIETLPDSPEKTILTVQLLLMENRTSPEVETAIESLIAEKNPKYVAEGLLFKAQLRLSEGKTEEARAVFKRLGEFPEAVKSVEYLLLQTMLAVRDERFNEAVDFYETLLKREPGNADIRLEYAELLAAAPAVADRFPRLNNLRAEFSGNARAAALAYYIDALAAAAKGDSSAASEAFAQTRLLVVRPAAIMLAMNTAIYTNDFLLMETLIPTVSALPENHVLRKNIASNLETAIARMMQAGDTANMNRTARVLLAVSPDHIMALRAVLRDAIATGKWEEARVRSEAILRTRPDDLEAIESRMVALFRLGRTMESLSVANAALEKSPAFIPAMLYRARILTLQRRTDDAGKAWMALIALPKALTPAIANEAAISLIRLNQEEALNTLCALLEKQENPELKVTALLARAQTAIAKNNPAQAETMFRQAIALMPDSEDLYLMFAGSIADPTAQAAVLREGLARLPGAPALTLTLCNLLLHSGNDANVQACLPLLDAAREKSPDFSGLDLMRSDVLNALKRPDEALAVVEVLFKKTPQDPVVNAVVGLRRAAVGYAAESLSPLRAAFNHHPPLPIPGIKEAFINSLRLVAREGKVGFETLWSELLTILPGDAEATAALASGGQP